MKALSRNTILVGDALARLRELPADQIDCVITSPPYYGLRDYGVAGQIGLEQTVDAWVKSLSEVCSELARVLKPTGSLWLNLGDSFSRHPRFGAPTKGLLLAPERLLLALAEAGWIVRNKVIWAKTNPMPTSVSDRLNLTYDVVYFFVRSRRYFFDLDAIREPHRSASKPRHTTADDHEQALGPLAGNRRGLNRLHELGRPGHLLGKNPGDVWRLGTSGFHGAHFATFPTELVRRPLLATCPEAICTSCGRPWERQRLVKREGEIQPTPADERFVRRYPSRWRTTHERGPLVPCGCGAPTKPGLVLDPFMGTGTVAAVAKTHQRDWLGIELNPAYVDLAWQRLGGRPPTYTRSPALVVAA